MDSAHPNRTGRTIETIFDYKLQPIIDKVDQDLSAMRRLTGLYRAAYKFGMDIGMGLGDIPRRESTKIPRPYCFLQGSLRETSTLTQKETQEYHVITNRIRQGQMEWKELSRHNYDGNLPLILVEYFRDIAFMDLYYLGHLPYPIPRSTPRMPERVYDFLKVEVRDEHALQALQEVQASVRVGLKNALRIHQGEDPVVVPVDPELPEPLFLWEGLLMETQTVDQRFKEAYLEEQVKIRSGRYEYHSLVTKTVANLILKYPGDRAEIAQGFLVYAEALPEPPTRDELVYGLGEFKLPEHLERFLNRKFYLPILDNAATCLKVAIQSGLEMRTGINKTGATPFFNLPNPLVFVDGRLELTKALTTVQKFDWEIEMIKISNGTCNWERLSSNLREDENTGAYEWIDDSKIKEMLKQKSTPDPITY